MGLMDKPRSVIVRSAATPFGFAVKFVICFSVLFGAFEASRGSAFERFVVEDLILVPTTDLINVVTPNEYAQRAVGRVISSPGSNLHVTRGCEGIEMFLLLVAFSRGRRRICRHLGSRYPRCHRVRRRAQHRVDRRRETSRVSRPKQKCQSCSGDSCHRRIGADVPAM